MKRYFKLAVRLTCGAMLLGVSLAHLMAAQTSLRMTPAATAKPGQFTLKVQLQSTSNSVVYVIQTSTNLVNWNTLVSGKTTPGAVVQIADVTPTNKAQFFRVNEMPPNLLDTNPPAWTNGVGGQFTLTPPSGIAVGWNPATDNVGVAQYSIYINGVLVTNLSGSTLSYQFTLNYQSPTDIRIQASDASSNASPILSLIYLPGNEIAAVSDDSGRVYTFNYLVTNSILTNGGFAPRNQIINFGGNDRGLVLGDFNRDGILDLVAAYANGNTLNAYFFKGNGDGTFAAPVQLPNAVGTQQNSYVMDMAVGDFDGDGNLDVAVNGNGPTVAFYWGNGDGTFTPSVQNLADGNYYNGRGMVAGDFNEDGVDDLARGTCCSGMVKLLISNGDRTFIQTNLIASGLGDNDPYGMAAGDFDEDGHLDLLLGGGSSGDIYFLKGLGNGTFAPPVTNGPRANLDLGTYSGFKAYDYNGDGHLDIVMADYNGQAFYFPGNGDGTFSTNRVMIATGMSSALGVAVAPRAPRVDVNIVPQNPVTNIQSSITYSAVGVGVSTNDFFRWTFGDTGTNLVAFNFGTNNMGPTVSHYYPKEGRFLTRLWHTTANGGTNSVRGTWAIVKGQPPVANPGGPYVFGSQVATNGIWYATVDGSGSTDDFGIVSYVWNFGDGTTWTTNTPTAFHGWPSNGVYTVTLTVYDAAEQSNTKSTTITFTNGVPPVASITGPAIVDETYARNGTWTAVYYATNSSSPVGVWQYYWKNVTTGQTGNNYYFQTTWNAVGTNIIDLTVTANDSQTNFTSQAVWVKANALPVPVIQGPHLLDVSVSTNGLWYGAWNATNSTDDTGIYIYAWNFGDGATASGPLTSHNYTAAGIYNLTLTVTDNGNQSVTATQTVVVVAGNPPVARITASTLSPEGSEPISFSADSSTSDHGIYQYTWFLPGRQFDFFGQNLDPNQWESAYAVQNNKLTVTGQGNWGTAYFFSVGTLMPRGGTIQGQVDTPSTSGTYAMVGLKNLNVASAQYGQYPYAIYFENGSVQIYQNGGYYAQVTNFLPGTAYDIKIVTKPGAGATYYLRPSGTGQPFAQIYDTAYGSDPSFSFGADVNAGVLSFENFQVDQRVASGPDIKVPVNPGGTVTLQVVDSALLTNSTSVVVTPVVGNPPTAAISGPTNAQSGVQLAFNGYGSTDDYGIASYTWNFGDGSAAAFGPAVSHSYGTAGVYTNTLVVADYAEQTATASVVVTVTGSNILVHVPWLIINGLEEPHPIYAGKTNTLKAVARNIPVPFSYIWNYGDGSGTFTNTVTNAAAVYNLEATHAYSGGDGTPYYAQISVLLTNGTVYQDRYPLLISTKTLNIEEEVAIDEGLWHLQKTQTDYNVDTNTPGGYWSSIGTISATASSIQAFAINGHLMTDDPTHDPYVDTVQRGVNYLLNNLSTIQLTPVAYGDPDAEGNGFGLQANSGQPIYEGGPVIDCFVATARPELVATTGAINVKGRTFKDIVQNMVDMFMWGQYQDPVVGGGWRYSWQSGPDNSASQWGAIGMLAAQNFWGCQVPNWVKQRNLVWVNYSEDNYGFGYTGPGSGAGLDVAGEDACTPSALVQASFDGIPSTNALWVHGENYIASNWASLMANNNLYANYSIAKAMRTAIPQPVQTFPQTGLDWFNDPVIGLARVTIDHQATDGSWVSSTRLDEPLASAFSVLILSSSLFQQGPVGVISVKPNPSAIGYPVVFDGSSSYDKDPANKIVSWRWIFNATNGSDFSHPDAVGPVVTNVYGALSTNTVLLQVSDNNIPPLTGVASVSIQTTVPPYPPTADAGGPYVACAGEDVHLDGSGSFCVDAASGNFIQSYNWEVNYQVPVTFNQGVSGVQAVITNGYPLAGNYTIGLEVKNANSLVYTNFNLPDETADAFTTVYVYSRVIPDLKVRPKATKAQLTWTKAGDYGVIMRSSTGPDRGFVQVGQTSSSYATYLDTTVAYNTDYYYRIYAYKNGGTAPIGISDAVFIHSAPRSFDQHAPQFQAAPTRLAKVGQLYEVTLSARSLENEAMYFSLLEGPTNMTVNTTSGLVDFTPTAGQVGNIPLSFQVTNSVGRDVLSYTLFVFPATNHPPVVKINGPYNALTGQNIQFSSAGTVDVDNNPLLYYWNFGDGTTSTNPNPVHVYGGVGEYLVSLFVNDGYGNTVSAQTQAHITRPDVPPVAIVSNGPNFTVRLGETLTLDGSQSYSPLGNPLTFSWVWGDGAVSNNTPPVATHLYADGGPYAGNLIVADNRGESNAYSFTVTMGPPSQAPVISFTVNPTNPYIQGVVTFDATATVDPLGDPMSFTWDFGDHSKTTGPLVTHVFQQITNFTVTLTVADTVDTNNGVSVASQTLTVVDAPPVFTSSPQLLTRAGSNYVYVPTVTDAAGSACTFTLIQGPTTMSCDPASGTLTWLPGTNNIGPNAIDLRATDAYGGTTDQIYTLVVSTALGPQIDLQPTHIVTTNVVVDSQSLAYSGTVRVYLQNNGPDIVPIPFTVSLFVSSNFNGTFDTNTDTVVGYGIIPAGFPGNATAYVDMGIYGQAIFSGCPIYAFVDSQDVVPEYNKLNNIMRSGADANTNTPPVIDFSASYLRVSRFGLPTNVVLTARLGNSGLVSVDTNVPMSFYDGDPQAGGTLIGVAWSTNTMAPGQFEDLSINWSSPTITQHTVYVVADDLGDGAYEFQEITYSNNTFSVLEDLSAVLPPVADAGPNQNVNLGDTVTLNGRASYDPQGRSLTYQWSMVSVPIGSQAQLTGTNTVSPSFVADVAGLYNAQLIVNDGLVASTNPASVYIAAINTNTYYPPTITSTPSFQGMVSVPYAYPVTATDPQNKPLKFRLPQAPAGMTINTNTGLVQWTPTNSGSFLVQVAADGVGGSFYQGYTLTVVPFANLPPQFTSTPVTTVAPTANYSYTAVAVSPDAYTVTYTLNQAPSGMNINVTTGVISWTPSTSAIGAHSVTIMASDGHGQTATQTYNLVVLNSNPNGPTVQPIPDQTVTAPATFTSFALDNYVTDPNYSAPQLVWTATGTNLLSVTIDSNRIATVLYPPGVNTAEQITFLATDPAGNSGYSTPTFTVINSANPPVAAIANLSADTTTSITTGTFNLMGTADDPGVPTSVVVGYQIGLYDNNGNLVKDLTPTPLDGSGFHDGRVPGTGSLGNLDFTTVKNGSYTLLLQVQANGQVASTSAQVAIDTPLKIGELTFAQQDLILPVQGVGLQVTRSYDSYNRVAASFGYSWTYSVADLGLTIGDQRVDTQDADDSSDFSLRVGGSWDVTLTMPDTGRTVTFKFGLAYGSFTASAGWTPPAWVNASLVPTCSSTLDTLPGLPPIWQAAGEDTDYQAFDWPGFVLTLQNGTQYVIAREDLGQHFYVDNSGFAGFVHAYGTAYLSEIIEPDGTHTTFVHDGTAAGLDNIVQYNATNQPVSSILFQRDGSDRIAGIYTPQHLDANGNPSGPADVAYGYDSISNLISVSKLTDGSDTNAPVYSTFSYFYSNPQFPHLLTEIKDPRGIAILQAQFDSLGRLTGTVDANGNFTALKHDTAAQTETVFDRMGNPTQYGYDQNGNVVSKTDPLGNTTTMSYDANNNLTSLTDPLGNTTTFKNDGSGNLTGITDARGNTLAITFGANGNPTSFTDALGHTTTNLFDSAGRLTSVTDPLGNTVQHSFDNSGNMTDIIDASGVNTVHLNYGANSHPLQAFNAASQPTTLGYDPNGHVNMKQTQWINPNNTNDVRSVTAQILYDAAGRMTNNTDITGHSSSVVYDQLDDIIQSTDNRGNTTTNAYDPVGNLIESWLPSGLVCRMVYDADGRMIAAEDPHPPGVVGNGTETIYDADSRVVSTVRLSNVVVQVSSSMSGGIPALESSLAASGGVISSNYVVYDADGRKIAVTGTDGQTTRYVYDAIGNNTAVIDPLGNQTTYRYNGVRQMTAVIDPEGNETDFLYDAAGRKTQTVYPNGSSSRQMYLPNGQPSTQTDPLGYATTYLYDSVGAPYSIVTPQVTDPEAGNTATNPTYTAVYDPNMNLAQMIDPKGRATSYQYDQLNHLTARTLPLGQTSQTSYNSYGVPYHITDFDGQVTEYLYDQFGRGVTNNFYPAGSNAPAETRVYSYDRYGRVVQMKDTQGITAQSFDLDGHLIQMATPQGTINYAYDPATGRKIRTWTGNTDTRYSYDQLGRLEAVTAVERNGHVLSVPEVTTYTYTALGNRASMTLPTGVQTLYSYDNMNRLSQLQNVGTNGNLLSAFSYQYNADNYRTGAVEIVQGADAVLHTNNITYGYDALNRLVSETARDLSDGTGYQAEYTYDLVGNRLNRTITTAGKTLTTFYNYDANDRLLMESNVVSAATASGTTSLPYVVGSSGRKVVLHDLQFAKVCYYTLKVAPYGLLAAFLAPAAWVLLRRRERPAVLTLNLNPHRALLPRCVAALLAAMMVFFGFDPNGMANQAVYYAALTTDTWGLDGSVTRYQYDANGSCIQKVTTGPKPETVVNQYNVSQQLVGSTRTYSSGGSQIVETTTQAYNSEMMRVKSTFASTVNGVLQSSSTNIYLLDPANPTGQSQVIEELPAVGAIPSISYTIGDDIIAQSSSSTGDGIYLLKDGHDSVRQLTSGTGAVTDHYGYDAYGIMFGGNPTQANPSTTKMLYSGQQFDSALGLYNMRARFYDPGIGRFTSMDPYAGSPQDPKSLHKYTYCEGDPVNYRDPSGMDLTLGEVIATNVVIASLLTIGGAAFSSVWSVLAGGSFAPDAAVWGISATASGQAALIGIAGAITEALRPASDFGGSDDVSSHQQSATFLAGFGFLEGYFLGLVYEETGAIGKFAGGSLTVGAEYMATTKDGTASVWKYFGPGFYLSPSGGGGIIGGSAAIYAGTVWNVDGWRDYAGPFISIGLGSNVLGIGWTVSWFFSPSNPMQNGTSTGLTVTVPPGGKGLSIPDAGFSYVTYTGIDVDQYDPALLSLAFPAFWQPFLLYKWYKKTM